MSTSFVKQHNRKSSYRKIRGGSRVVSVKGGMVKSYQRKKKK